MARLDKQIALIVRWRQLAKKADREADEETGGSPECSALDATVETFNQCATELAKALNLE